MAIQFFLVSLLIAIMTRAGDSEQVYKRTVNYEDDILVKCSNLKKNEIDNLMKAEGIDVWKVDVEGNVDFRIEKVLFANMVDTYSSCKESGKVEEIVHRAEEMHTKRIANETRLEWFEEYHPYADIVDWWKKLSEDNPDEVTFIESIGKTYEGRDMPVVIVTSSSSDNPKIVYFQCQIHAREWVSASTCMYIINYIMENKDEDRVRSILNDVKFVIVPIANPDGYVYTWTTNRLWRKNRRRGESCYGIDLNRNFEYHWGEDGSSGNPCSETYHGTSPASEVETQHIENYYRSIGNVILALDWHSFGQLILRRYGWTMTDCPDETKLKAMADEMRDIIMEYNGNIYTSQKSSQLYTSSGTASDWFYSDLGNVINDYRAAAYTIELRDNGLFGFLLPPSQIIPTGDEWIAPVFWLIETLKENPLPK